MTSFVLIMRTIHKLNFIQFEIDINDISLNLRTFLQTNSIDGHSLGSELSIGVNLLTKLGITFISIIFKGRIV